MFDFVTIYMYIQSVDKESNRNNKETNLKHRPTTEIGRAFFIYLFKNFMY